MASPDPSGQNALAGIMADIGIEQIAGSSLQCPDLSNTRERPYDRFDAGNLRVSEPAHLLRGPSCHVNRVVSEDQRGGEIIGRALRAQLAEYRKLLGFVLIRQLLPDGLARFDDGDKWAVQELISFQEVK